MCTHPHVQRVAQAELDNVIGRDRLPTISDRAQLAYINALVKELWRWGPIAPLGELLTFPSQFATRNWHTTPSPPLLAGIPHRVMEEDIYKGYRIPAGSLVIANIWCASLTHGFDDMYAQISHSIKGDAAWSRDIPQPRRVQTWEILRGGKGRGCGGKSFSAGIWVR